MSNSDLKRLKQEWYNRLANEGFVDIEDKKGNLKYHDIRTIGFTNRDAIMSFFIRLEGYLEAHDDIPPLHRQILKLYCDGAYQIHIARVVNRSTRTCRRIVTKYKKIITGG